MRTSRAHANHYIYPREHAQERIHRHATPKESMPYHCCNTLHNARHGHGHLQTSIYREGGKQRGVQGAQMKRTKAKHCTHPREHARGRSYRYQAPRRSMHRPCCHTLQTY